VPIHPTTSAASPRHRPRRLRGQSGEGVISAAIAVLIVAFLGALMWIGFQQIWANAEAQTNEQINQIGG
jgi:uncharacterized protein HemX